ncbi:MAG: pseudouridine synthase [Ruminococcaceae bacterium]|jgi:23S rRNA pseudouridine2604 synthase|nr:pseudouridine synthase [Oscillospiraceae bacterium]
MSPEKTADQENAGIRVNKYLASQGICSRREADRLIAAGDVTIADQVAQPGSRVLPGQKVHVRGKAVQQDPDMIYIAMYKPIGVTCTTDLRRHDNIISYLGLKERVFPVGRLDRDSEGMIFLTNDGSIVNKILKSGSRQEKEYRVTVDKPLTTAFLEKMASGVPILNTITRPCQVKAESRTVFRIILTQGLNRQIRRMCEACGYTVRHLTRLRVMHMTLAGLKPGQWRYFSEQEIEELHQLIKSKSSEEPL